MVIAATFCFRALRCAKRKRYAIGPCLSHRPVMTDHRLKLDHLVIAARTLEEGAQFVAAKFGVETVAGGAHPLMRTHNRLLNLWGGAYLEVIAIDPSAGGVESPRPRLFALD